MEVGITGFFDSGPDMDTVQIELVKLRPQLAAFLFKAGDYRITERLHFWKRAKLKDFSLRVAVKMSLMSVSYTHLTLPTTPYVSF